MDDLTGQFELTEEQKAASKKRRKRYIIYAVVLVLVAAAILGAAAYFIMNDNVEEKRQHEDSALIDQANSQGETSVSAGPSAVTEVPNIAGLIGMSGDEAVSLFGSSVKSTSDKDVAQEDSNVAVLRRIELNTKFDDANANQSTAGVSGRSNPAVSLSLAEDGTVLSVYYTVDLNLLGVNSKMFNEVISDTALLSNYMMLAGIPVNSGELVPPAEGAIEITQAEQNGRTVTAKESYAYEGDATIEAVNEVRHWTLSLEYDHSLANTTGNATDTSRTLGIRISPPPYEAAE